MTFFLNFMSGQYFTLAILVFIIGLIGFFFFESMKHSFNNWIYEQLSIIFAMLGFLSLIPLIFIAVEKAINVLENILGF